jgi:hypothetical protein
LGKVFDAIDERMREWLQAQRMFFVASAPLSGDGLVNLSPKGLDSFAVLGPRRVAYLDLTGSGIETVAHLRENGRITLLFCAFEGPPRLLRIYGRGEAVLPGAADFEELAALFPHYPSTRAVIRIDVTRIADSCGYGVPLYAYEGERSQIGDWAASKGEAGMRAYRAANNARSLDGLPGLPEGGA